MLNEPRQRSPLCCREVNAFLVAYGENTLEESLRKRFEEHLAHCARCKCYLDQYTTTIALVKESGQEEHPTPPEELIQLTLSFLREQLGEDLGTGGCGCR